MERASHGGAKNGSLWGGTSHSGARQVIVERNGPVLELTLVQVIQARPPRCWFMSYRIIQ